MDRKNDWDNVYTFDQKALDHAVRQRQITLEVLQEVREWRRKHFPRRRYGTDYITVDFDGGETATVTL